jgi:hypothetical protein
VSVPDFYFWNSLSECIADVKAWEGKEGIVLHSPDGQILKKIKSDSYLRLHSMMFGMQSINNVLDVFVTCKTNDYDTFYKFIKNTIDHEVAENCKHHIETITIAYANVEDKMNKLKHFLDNLPKDYTRKEQAQAIHYNYKDWRVSAAFALLDKKQFDDKFIKQTINYEINFINK